MLDIQRLFIAIYGLISLIIFLRSYGKCTREKKNFEETRYSAWITGGFVHADNVVFGPFWVTVAFLTVLLDDWLLFLLILSVFWLVRSVGETIYWLLQQYRPRPGNQPEKFWHYRIFHDESVWFVNQIFWQCATVITTITTIYLANLWININ